MNYISNYILIHNQKKISHFFRGKKKEKKEKGRDSAEMQKDKIVTLILVNDFLKAFF